MGAGLGSSAAIEVAAGQALLENSNIGVDRATSPRNASEQKTSLSELGAASWTSLFPVMAMSAMR